MRVVDDIGAQEFEASVAMILTYRTLIASSIERKETADPPNEQIIFETDSMHTALR